MTVRAAALAVALAALAGGAARAAPPTLTLADAVRAARAHHPAVVAQRGQLQAARGRNEQALAPLLPYLLGGIAYEPQTANLVATPPLQRSIIGSTGTDNVVDTSGMATLVTCRTPGIGACQPIAPGPTRWGLHDFVSFNVGASWTLWDWGRSLYGLRAAHAQSAAAEVGVRTAQQDVALDAKVAFFAALAADDGLIVARQAVDTYRAQLDQTRAFHDAGLRTGIDVATAESALASAHITLSRALAQVATARALLAQAIGVERGGDWQLVAPPQLFDLTAEDEARVARSPDALAADALARRPELRQLALGERANLATLRAVRAQYLPALSLEIDPTWAGPSFDLLTGNVTIGIALSYPLSGMSPLWVHGQTREAAGNLAVTRAQTQAERDDIRAETVAARAQLGAARDELLAARALVEAAARQRALAEGRYQTGVGNIIELYDALLTDVNARFQMVQARLDLATARARLQHALGDDDLP